MNWPVVENKVPLQGLDFDDAVATLRSGGVLILATDTLPGFHCLVDCQAAVARIAQIKGRASGKPLLVLAADLEQAAQVHGSLQTKELDFARLCWPGPFTLVVPANPAVPRGVSAGTGTIGIRVPAHDPLRQLLEAVGQPLVSTSVNKQGEPPAVSLSQAVAEFGGLVDGFWSGGDLSRGSDPAGQSSALVDLTQWPPLTLRQGPKPVPEVSL